MAVLYEIFGFVAVLLRGLQLAFEAIAAGGFIFLFAIARLPAKDPLFRRLARYIGRRRSCRGFRSVCWL